MVNEIEGNVRAQRGATVGTMTTFENIREPGCYVCQWSGHLLRVPEGGIIRERSLPIDLVGLKPLLVTRISDYPYIKISRARAIASDIDCEVNF